MTIPLLEAEGLVRRYRLPRERLFACPPEVLALDRVSLAVAAGRSMGVVGESGSGKSTLARIVMALDRPDAGTVRFEGQDLKTLSPRALARLRPKFQMVFQDPYGSLDPRRRVGWSVAEPLHALRAGDARERVAQALSSVGLRPDDARRYPHEFSGGQRQRIAIARALVGRPRLIVADEPVSALDVSVQAQIIDLLQDLTADGGVTLLLISHDLAVVDSLCDEVAVLHRGRIVEQGSCAQVFGSPAHAYTRRLVAAAQPRKAGRGPRTAERDDLGAPAT